MKSIQILNRIVLYCATLAAVGLCPQLSQASPYASALNYYAASNAVTFILNEGGVTYPTSGSTANPITNLVSVVVTYEDGTTNDVYNGTTAASTNATKGLKSFYMTNSAAPGVNHTGYSIAVTKIGNGTYSQISTDTAANGGTAANYSYFFSPRGMAVNQNPKIGSLFGRVYVANDGASSASGYPQKGLYILNADLSCVASNTAVGTGIFANSGTSGPWKLRVGPENQVLVGDYSTPSAALWQFAPDLSSSNLLLGPVGQTVGQSVFAHGDMFGTAHISGSLANSNLVLWVADSGMPVPTQTQDPHLTLGPGTTPGMYNNVYRYDIGAGPLPWTNAPDYAYNLGLDVISELVVESDVAPDGKVFTAFGRSNLSNPVLTVLETNGASILWTSWADNPSGNGDPWRGDIVNSTVMYPYAGIRVSSDDKYIVSSGYQAWLILAKMTNGIPDDNTMFVITNGTAASTSRGGVDWDAADNVYQINGNSVELRSWSLGLTATCVTSNDITGTNGTFVVITPPVAAAAVATTPSGSQGYGSPTPAVITISITTNILTAPTTVSFLRSGTASYITNYTLNIGTNADGVIITPTNVTFPAGTYPHGGNWSVNVQLTPTPIPVSGPTLTATFTLLGGAAYTVGGSTAKATITLINTGPQLLTLSVLPIGSTMSRAVTNDYVTFLITRFGDTTVPAYTITNINYQGTASYPADYTAQAQRFISGSLLTDGSPGITINPGEVFITNALGNPLMRANLNVPPTNVTIVLSLTNAVTGTNATSTSGYTFIVATNAITLTELDNAVGSRVLLWSSPLNDPADSKNWTLTYASQKLSTSTVLPVVIPNYTNNVSSIYGAGGSNDFDVEFGYPLPAGVPPSPAMVANNWTNVLKMTVNKTIGAPTGVNLYPQGQKFNGNYALRFSMYLSILSSAVGNIYAGVVPREYAIFGLNHSGTNCNWRSSTAAPAGTSGTTNADGIWFAIDEADNAATPADFDAFTSPALPNKGIVGDFVSNAGSAMRGIFKNPPFINTQNPLGGEPVNQWVDVSVEITRQTNCTIYINGAPVLSSFSIGATNSTTSNTFPGTNGTVMLGYLDPDASIGDGDSQYVLYSNVRALELSPYIATQAKSLIVTNGANVSFVSSGIYATAPITNIWSVGVTNVSLLTLQTDTAAATNLTSTLSLTNVQVGTNYLNVFSDAAGSVTGLLAQLEVIAGPTNVTTNSGATVKFTVTPSGPAAPTAYQWYANSVKLTNNAHYFGTTNATLFITNVLAADAVTYTVGVTNTAGFVLPSASLSVATPLPPTLSNFSLVGTNAVLTFASPNSYDGTNSYTLLSSPIVQGPYVSTAGTFTGSAGSFQVVVPLTTNTTMFYRLQHN